MNTQAESKDSFKLLILEFHSQLIPKTYTRDLTVPLDSKKIVAVYGPRRCGKSYFFYTLIQSLLQSGVAKEKILYLNFEDDRILPLNGRQLGALIEAYYELYPENKAERVFFFFDEIQNVDGWEVFVRRIHDKENIRIFLTGSSSKLLSKEIATSLRGRTIGFPLHPLSFREYLRFKGMDWQSSHEFGPERFKLKKALDDYLEHGGFPEVVLEDNDLVRNKILEEYFESLVFRDIGERHRVENMDLLKDILKYLFTETASLFSINSYHKAVKQSMPVSRQTVMGYLKLIRETQYFIFLQKFAWSFKERRVNPQKIICLDLGMRNRLIFRFSPDQGRSAENVVGATLSRNEDTVFYWQGKREVDFIVSRKEGLEAINVSYGTGIPERELEGLLEFKKSFMSAKRLTLITKDTEAQRGPVRLIPLWKWLLGSVDKSGG